MENGSLMKVESIASIGAFFNTFVTGQVVLIWTSEILQITMVFNDDLHGDSEIIYI